MNAGRGLPPPFFRPPFCGTVPLQAVFFRFFFKLYFPEGYSFLFLPRSAEKLNEEKCYNKKTLLCSSLWEIFGYTQRRFARYGLF